MRPTNRTGQATSNGHAARARLPGRPGELVDLVAGLATEQLGQVVLVAGRARAPRGGRPAAPAPQVRFAVDSHTAYLGGSMLACEWKPTRQPSRSSADRDRDHHHRAVHGGDDLVERGRWPSDGERRRRPSPADSGRRAMLARCGTTTQRASTSHAAQLLVGSAAPLVAFLAGCSDDDDGGDAVDAGDPTTTRPPPDLSGDPFTLGVASGDPLPDAVVLWTRLAPEPLAADGLGGMPDEEVDVRVGGGHRRRLRRRRADRRRRRQPWPRARGARRRPRASSRRPSTTTGSRVGDAVSPVAAPAPCPTARPSASGWRS